MNRKLMKTAGALAGVLISIHTPAEGVESATATALRTNQLKTQAKYIPQRKDDIAWENDRIAFRIYGPELAKTEPTGSGIDVWVKSTRELIIDKWYKGGDYHKDHGEGLDFYSVGPSRGCGGLGIWDGSTLYTSGHWASYEIRAGADFSIEYAPWTIQGGHQISEHRNITLEPGSNLNRLESVLKTDLPEFVVGIGIAKGSGGEIYQDAERGILAYWQKPHAEHGAVGCAVIVNPQDVKGFASDKLNHLILVQAKSGVPLIYRAGACWSKGLDFKTFDEWKNYLIEQAGVTGTKDLPVDFTRPDRPFMLVSPEELTAAKAKIKTQRWAAEGLKALCAQADEIVADPQFFPESEGGWSHKYVSPKSAKKLEFDPKSPRRHLDSSTGEYLTGKQYDDAWNVLSIHFTAKQQEVLAAAWTLTQDKRYAETMRTVFLDIAKKYKTYRLHDKSMVLLPPDQPIGTNALTGGYAA
ncbi:MAG: DUF4861 domain-containing protein, partial [Pontiellaceae bacterium]|nr:DUF4861 domain-containing protein [Pontiellaceae bacterium]